MRIFCLEPSKCNWVISNENIVRIETNGTGVNFVLLVVKLSEQKNTIIVVLFGSHPRQLVFPNEKLYNTMYIFPDQFSVPPRWHTRASFLITTMLTILITRTIPLQVDS